MQILLRHQKSEKYFEYVTRFRVYNLCSNIVIVSLGKILIGCCDLFTTFEFVTVNIFLTMSDVEILSKRNSFQVKRRTRFIVRNTI